MRIYSNKITLLRDAMQCPVLLPYASIGYYRSSITYAATRSGSFSETSVSLHLSTTGVPRKTSCSTCLTSSTNTNSMPVLTLSGTFSSMSDLHADGTISSAVQCPPRHQM